MAVAVGLVAATAGAAEAVAAIDGLVATRHEGNARDAAAGVTARLVHLAGGTIVVATAGAAAVAAAALAGGPALGAAAGGVGEAARGIKFLLADCKRKRLATVTAGQGLFGIRHCILSMCAQGAELCGAIRPARVSRAIPTASHSDREGKTTTRKENQGPILPTHPLYNHRTILTNSEGR